ncbi:hypothetical protein M446_4515 [Methylobacterium sp. 4-46]|nr:MULTISPECIES: hypothetical protein [Methylobacterium]ACA18856.1 hypothetical protein M446_4515 [Methylobacterium sp. 4-46]WFT78081.1 hypothetical protein QA634_22655 [Methylobacterium nodulans]
MVRALSLIQGCLGLLREGWPVPRLRLDHVVDRLGDGPGRAGR